MATPYAFIDESSFQYVTEGDDGITYARFRVQLSEVADHRVRVWAETSSLSLSDWATPGVDFESVGQTLTFRPGQTSRTVKVAIVGDEIFEADETFKFEISNARGAELHPDTSKHRAYAQITNDDLSFAFETADYLILI